MNRFAFALLAALSLGIAACAGFTAPAGVPTSPSEAADTTVLDERAALSVELAYKALRLAMETAVDAGALTGERARQAAALDNRAYAAVVAVRTAYRAGNAQSYATAVDEARAAIGATLDALR